MPDDEDTARPRHMPPLAARELPAKVVAARAAKNSPAAEEVQRIGASLDTHLTTFTFVLDTLEADHQVVADQLDFELDGDTRYAAVWQLAGRCIGLGRAVVVLLRASFCAETLVVARTLHECTRLLEALEDVEDGDALLVRWLADNDRAYVRPAEARLAERRAEKRHREDMIAGGLHPSGTSDKSSADLSADLYDHLSWFGHNRRKATRGFVDVARHTMVRGPHRDPVVVASYVAYGGQAIEEMLLSVGYALSRFIGLNYLADRVFPLQDALRRARRDAPLP